MSLTDNQKEIIAREVEEIRDIGEWILTNTNIREELIPDMANAIYMRGNYR